MATHTIGEKAGVISGCALLVDYMLTITVSLVSCADALFSFLPMSLHHYKIGFVVFLIVLLVVLNAEGREGVGPFPGAHIHHLCFDPRGPARLRDTEPYVRA